MTVGTEAPSICHGGLQSSLTILDWVKSVSISQPMPFKVPKEISQELAKLIESLQTSALISGVSRKI
jgi:hypothetical protein